MTPSAPADGPREVFMRLLPGLTLASLLSAGCAVREAEVRTVYGTDDRVEIASASPEWQARARSVGLVLESSELKQVDNGFAMDAPPLTSYGVCAGEAFAEQPILGQGTGFLIGPDIFVTAGHVIKNCARSAIVFDVMGEIPAGRDYVAPADNVFFCKEVLSYSLVPNADDYAVIRLDRPVRDRTPLQFRAAGLPKPGAALTLIGHPTGLPMKIAAGDSLVRSASEDSNIVFAQLDSFQGNSGSPVFDRETGLVEGILIDGDNDFEQSDAGCKKVTTRESGSGTGEYVMRLPAVVPFLGDVLTDLQLARAQTFSETLANLELREPAAVSLTFDGGQNAPLGIALVIEGQWRGSNCLDARVTASNGRQGKATLRHGITTTVDGVQRVVLGKPLGFGAQALADAVGQWKVEIFRPDGCGANVSLSRVELRLYQ